MIISKEDFRKYVCTDDFDFLWKEMEEWITDHGYLSVPRGEWTRVFRDRWGHVVDDEFFAEIHRRLYIRRDDGSVVEVILPSAVDGEVVDEEIYLDPCRIERMEV